MLAAEIRAPRVVFLHLPKTAGQSIRAFLTSAFPRRRVFPGQIDAHLSRYSKRQLEEFDIFCGHFSWSLLDFFGTETRFFTVLRDPAERVVSFYLYLQRKAELLDVSLLEHPENAALRACKCMRLDELVFRDEEPGVKELLDLIDNLYVNFFATRRYGLSQDFQSNRHDNFIMEQYLQTAIENLSDNVEVYKFTELNKLCESFESYPDYKSCSIQVLNEALSTQISASKFLEKSDLDGNVSIREVLHRLCIFDHLLYQRFCS